MTTAVNFFIFLKKTVTAEAKIGTLADTFTKDVITSQIFEAVTTKSFNISTSFGVTVLEGYLVADTAIYANATKKGEVVFQKDLSPSRPSSPAPCRGAR